MDVKKRIYDCKAPNCLNNSSIEGVILHKLPENEDIRTQWINQCKLIDICSSTFICNLHFKKEDYSK